MSQPEIVRHNRSELALWALADGDGTPLLILNGLGERSPLEPPAATANWAGPVFALDMTGHGQSTRPIGGGYTAEQLLGDVDAALARLGRSTLWGRGLGAYIALLASGARPELVAGAVLDDGPGLAGGGPAPTTQAWIKASPTEPGGPDAYALLEMSSDPRPPDYAMTFARLALLSSTERHPLVVAAKNRPPWLDAVASDPGVATVNTAGEALGLWS